MNVVDFVIIIFLALGAVAGFKAGVIKKTADFIGMFVIVVLAFYLKNYLSVIMYENLPFFNFGGFIKGIDAINILMYEAIAFVIVFIALLFILKVIVMVTGLIEKLLKATVILSIPSKILGIVVGAIESYVYIFLALVILTLPVFKIPYLRESKMANFIIDNTPVLSSVSEEMVGIYGDVYTIVTEKDNKTNEELNEDVLKLLLKREVVTKESARKLVEKNKIHINDKSIVD
ncbi:MAG: CvpA family protein [Bacilli bacterium]